MIESFCFTLMVFMIGLLVVNAFKGAGRALGSFGSSLYKPVDISCEKSPDGRFYAKNPNYDEISKLYGAWIIDTQTGEELDYAVGKTLEEFEEDIKKIYSNDGHRWPK